MIRLLALLALMLPAAAAAETDLRDGVPLPNGQRITPTAAPGAIFQPLNPNLSGLPDFLAGGAVAVALSPDQRTLLILTSGFNRVFDAAGAIVPDQSRDYVFVYDVSRGVPRKQQVLPIANAFLGLAWAPDGNRFYVSGGVDDLIRRFDRTPDGFVERGPIPLGHAAGLGLGVKPEAAGLAVSPDGHQLLVANYESDSVSLVDLDKGAVAAERDLRPGRVDPKDRGKAGGEYPVAVAWAGGKAYVASQRDRELAVLTIGAASITVAGRIPTHGQPVHLLPSRDGKRLFAALDNSDTVIAIDTASDRVLAEIPAVGPDSVLLNPAGLKGANPNFLAQSDDGQTLFVSLGGLNAVAVMQLGPEITGAITGAPSPPPADDDDAPLTPITSASRVIGLIPTGWYPNAVAVGADGRRLYAVNGKSPAGPDPEACRTTTATAGPSATACAAQGEYVLQLEHAGFLSMPMPNAATLARLTRQVARNDNFPSARPAAGRDERMAFLYRRIRHVIYIVKENRTYDQVLGDLAIGNGDPELALLPEAITPNHHALARSFATLDNFYDSGATSNTGWNWSTAARTTDFTEKTAPVNYAQRGLSYDWEGTNRNVNVGIGDPAARTAANPLTPDDPDLLPGTADVAAPDSAAGEAGAGYLWDAALRAGLSLRNYGFYGDLSRYDPKHPAAIPLDRDPHASARPVFFPTKAALAGHSDPFFRGYDQSFPDYWRVQEWRREFAEQTAADTVPALTLLRLPHDHFGNFAAAIDRVNTVETEMADNDYAVGLVIEAVAHSPVADSTLVFVVEDDAQNGADHVDAHRSLALVAGPYVRHRALVSERYTTVSVLRTIEAVLGLEPLGLNDGLADPMAELFDPAQARWTYTALVPEVLRSTDLPLPARRADIDGPPACRDLRLRSAGYWTWAMRGQYFGIEDKLDVGRFNRALWIGRKGAQARLPDRDGIDRRDGRDTLLAAFRGRHGCPG